MGSEDADFTQIGTITTPGSSSYYRTAWVRTALCTLNTGATDPPPNRIAATFSALSSFWVHARLGGGGQSIPTNNAQIFRLLDPSGNAKIVLRTTATYNTWSVWTRTNAGVFTQLGANFSAIGPNGPANSFDADVNYSTTGHFTLYIAGAQVFTFSGDVTTDGATQIARAEFSDSAGGGNAFNWSEVIVCDSDSRSMNLYLLNNGGFSAGQLQQWSGTFSNPNQPNINDANFISSATAAQIQDYKLSSALPAGIYSVLAVSVTGRASVSTTGPQHIEFGLNFNGTRFWTASLAPTLTFGNFANNIWNSNPLTGVAWTPADITATTFNVSIQSIT